MRASSILLSLSAIAGAAAAFVACSSSPANTPAPNDAGVVPTDSGSGGDTGTGGGDAGADSAPSSSPRIIYSGGTGGSQSSESQLFIVKVSDTTKETAITTKTAVEDIATDVSSDGKTVLFTRQSTAGPGAPWQLMTIGADGTGEKQVYTCAVFCDAASFGADGKVWFVERASLSATGKVRALDTSTGTATDVGTPSAACTIDGFALSRDRTQMIVTVNDAQGTGSCVPDVMGIYRAPISGSAFGTPFAVPGFAKTGRPWVNAKAGEGDSIYFFSPSHPVDGGTEDTIFSVTFNGTDVKTVTNNGSNNYAAVPTSAPTGAGVLATMVTALTISSPSLVFYPAAGGASKEIVGSRSGLGNPVYIP